MAEGNPPPVNLIQINKKDEMKEDLENDLKSGKFLGESLDKIENDKKDSEDLSDAMKANPLLGPVKLISKIVSNIESRVTLALATFKRSPPLNQWFSAFGSWRLRVCKSTLNIETNIETLKKLTLTLSRFSMF